MLSRQVGGGQERNGNGTVTDVHAGSSVGFPGAGDERNGVATVTTLRPPRTRDRLASFEVSAWLLGRGREDLDEE